MKLVNKFSPKKRVLAFSSLCPGGQNGENFSSIFKSVTSRGTLLRAFENFNCCFVSKQIKHNYVFPIPYSRPDLLKIFPIFCPFYLAITPKSVPFFRPEGKRLSVSDQNGKNQTLWGDTNLF